MTVTATASSAVLVSANRAENADNQPDSTNATAAGSVAKTSDSNTTTPPSAGQNVPSPLSDATTAALLRLQEVEGSASGSGAA